MIKPWQFLLSIPIITLMAFGGGCSDYSSPGGVTAPEIQPSVILPVGSTLVSATFHGYIYRIDDLNSEPVNLHRVLTPWDELTVTWNSFHPGGALNYDPTIDAFFDGVTANTPDSWVSLDVTDMVQHWMDGTYPNLGLLMRKENVSPRTVFYSREGSAPPYLEMEFYTPNGSVFITEPALADAMIGEHEPETAFGNTDKLYTGYKNNLAKHSLIIFDLPTITPREPNPYAGCTLTIGFWKTHAGQKKNQADEVAPLLPIWLGTAGGANSRLVADSDSAVEFLTMNTYGRPSNGITKLYAQLLGAKLSAASGASMSDVSTAFAEADAYLAEHDWTEWNHLSESDQSMILGWKDILDAYNNGDIGPGHCD